MCFFFTVLYRHASNGENTHDSPFNKYSRVVSQLHRVQAWQPTSAAPDDAAITGSSAGESQDTQGSQVAESQDKAPVNEEIQHDDTLLYELNQIMDDLEEGLPPVATPGPDHPQVLAECSTAVSKKELKDKAPEEAKKAVATPCRNKNVAQPQNAANTTSLSLRSLKAHEDLGNNM